MIMIMMMVVVVLLLLLLLVVVVLGLQIYLLRLDSQHFTIFSALTQHFHNISFPLSF